jgi:hypothetical protein
VLSCSADATTAHRGRGLVRVLNRDELPEDLPRLDLDEQADLPAASVAQRVDDVLRRTMVDGEADLVAGLDILSGQSRSDGGCLAEAYRARIGRYACTPPTSLQGR